MSVVSLRIIREDYCKMQPSKSMDDYMMELKKRFFPNSSESNVHTPTNFNFPSTFSQQTPNYSSGSTDPYSPETFPKLSYNQPRLRQPEYRPPETPRSINETPRSINETPRSINETPFALARRPIVGRKILGSSKQRPFERSPESLNFEQRFDSLYPITHWNNPETPTPNVSNLSFEPKSTDKNAFYELFPSEIRAVDFKTPVKTPLIYSNLSPTPTISQSSPTSNLGMFTPPRYTTPFNYGARSPNLGASSPMNLGATTSKFQDGVQKMCTFCRKNGETPLVYMTHTVKEKRGNKNIVTCPILRSHVCSKCGVSGDHAHTITYCPVLRSSNNGVPLKSTTITLKNTRIKSNGRRRY